jgi:dolichyl-phosphate-mannose--protein O-mannosyl transferase
MNHRKPFADMLQSNWIRYLVIYGLLLFFCLWGLDQVPFHGDESSWISSSYTYEAFLHLDFKSDVWQESYWTLTQPPLPRYFIGLGRTLGGYNETQLNQPLDFFLTEAENIARGAYPEANLLHWSRLPMAVLTSFSLFLLFYLVELGFGKLTSTVFLGFILFNPFLFSNLRLALGEAPLLFFTCLSILFAVLGLKSWKAGGDPNPSATRKTIFWFLLMGVACGLAAASKMALWPCLPA